MLTTIPIILNYLCRCHHRIRKSRHLVGNCYSLWPDSDLCLSGRVKTRGGLNFHFFDFSSRRTADERHRYRLANYIITLQLWKVEVKHRKNMIRRENGFSSSFRAERNGAIYNRILEFLLVQRHFAHVISASLQPPERGR